MFDPTLKRLTLQGAAHLLDVARGRGSHYVPRPVNLPTHRWKGPALLQRSYLGPLHLSSLSRALYASPLAQADVLAVWDHSVGILASHHDRGVFDWMAQAMPKVPVLRSGELGPLSTMVQFLYISSWDHGKFVHEKASVTLALDNVEIGIQRYIVKGVKKQHRVRRLPPLVSGLHMALGRTIKPMNTTSVLFEHLLKLMPHQEDQLKVFFSFVVRAGREYEKTLCSQFDIDRIPEEPIDPEEADAARRLIHFQNLVR